MRFGQRQGTTYIYIYFSQPVTHFINEYNWRICEQHKEKEKKKERYD